MTSTVLLTREPVINRNLAITANRLVVHAASVTEAVQTLNSLADIWPRRYAVFVSLARLVPTPELLRWQPPEPQLPGQSPVLLMRPAKQPNTATISTK